MHLNESISVICKLNKLNCAKTKIFVRRFSDLLVAHKKSSVNELFCIVDRQTFLFLDFIDSTLLLAFIDKNVRNKKGRRQGICPGFEHRDLSNYYGSQALGY